MTTTLQTYEPGIYRDVPADEYHRIPGASKSRLWTLRDSPAKCKWELDNGSPDSDAFRFGRGFDDALFDEETFKRTYEAAGPCGAELKSGKNKGGHCGLTGAVRVDGVWYCGKHAPAGSEPDSGLTILSDDEYRRIVNMVCSIEQHPIANALVRGPRGVNQLTIVWDDPATGVRCKGRIDRLTQYQGYTTHIDVKTARSADRRAFERDAAKFGYFVQAAHYLAGCEAIDLLAGREPQKRRFLFVVIEKAPELLSSHRVEVFEYKPDALAEALRVRDGLLAKWAECERTGYWPGREPRITPINLPLEYVAEPFEEEDQ